MGDSLWIYPFLAAITVLPLVPNSAPLAAAGAFAATGRLNLVLVVAIPLTGAFVGDLLVYAIGRRGSPRLLSRLSRHRRRDTTVQRASRHAGRHGVAVLIGVRFVPGGRLFAGLMAGLTRFAMWRYAAAMCTAEALFVACVVGIGYFGGSISANEYTVIAVGPAVSMLIAMGVLVAQLVARRRNRRLPTFDGMPEDARPRGLAAEDRWSR
ncbi:VTT domain-containing protein [Streptomyces sp. NPDC048277]|uniref:DedA family protein n=1 Tax=Streptomyces sp. NPDC048277 TaxID=3155027 RepID=UPI0033E0E328